MRQTASPPDRFPFRSPPVRPLPYSSPTSLQQALNPARVSAHSAHFALESSHDELLREGPQVLPRPLLQVRLLQAQRRQIPPLQGRRGARPRSFHELREEGPPPLARGLVPRSEDRPLRAEGEGALLHQDRLAALSPPLANRSRSSAASKLVATLLRYFRTSRSACLSPLPCRHYPEHDAHALAALFRLAG